MIIGASTGLFACPPETLEIEQSLPGGYIGGGFVDYWENQTTVDGRRRQHDPAHLAFVRESEGNGCVKRFIRTLKEDLLWVRRFDTIEELRLALHRFKELYNRTWIVERHGYRTPGQVRADQLGLAGAA